jgi:hypothetical protein
MPTFFQEFIYTLFYPHKIKARTVRYTRSSWAYSSGSSPCGSIGGTYGPFRWFQPTTQSLHRQRHCSRVERKQMEDY